MDRIRQERLSRLDELARAGVSPADRYAISHTLSDAAGLADGAAVRVAGRLTAVRDFGKLAFGDLTDRSGRLQVSFEAAVLGDEGQAAVMNMIDVGDFVGVAGEMFTSKKGERTVRAADVTLLAKALRPLPDKWAGVRDVETVVRQPYLAMMSSPEVRERLLLRARLVRLLRRFLDERGFVEFETPILQAVPAGASARPFITHHRARDVPLYLRIAPETFLKRLLVGGFDRVYEIGKNFRNEGIDPSHLQEFTMLEWYAAYWNYRDNMELTREMVQSVLVDLLGTTTVEHDGATLDFGGDWPEVDYRDAVADATGIDLRVVRTREDLAAAVAEAVPGLDPDGYPSYPSLVDALYKRTVRPQLVQPTFLTGHPAELVPLARRSAEDPACLDMFQLVAASWELVKGYSEVNDPLEQAARMREQAEFREQGDEEAAMFEWDYVEAMEYGMPPNSGVGLGVDRLLALLTGAASLREVVAFTVVRPEDQEAE